SSHPQVSLSQEDQVKQKVLRRLDQINTEMARYKEELRVATEQLSYQGEVADEAKTRMLVSDTPASRREFKEAEGDLELHRRNHQEMAKKIRELEAQRDRLLEELI
ncbi:MAG TPA: hypothetical protein VI541_04440, partial [Actinomycetota bacterium]|nr:hypothetical protein [Actinomycetota bacterium]